MTRQMTGYLKRLLVIALAVGMVLSANSRMAAHNVGEMMNIVDEHHAAIEDHGHAHDDITDLRHAYHGHTHDVIDHDHNTAVLLPRMSAEAFSPTSTRWALDHHAMSDRRHFDLDRPPRV